MIPFNLKQALCHFRVLCLTILVLIFPGPALHAEVRTVEAPMTMDYSLLKTLVASSFFTEPGQKNTLLKDEAGCREIIISEPRFYQDEQRLFLEVLVDLRSGKSMGDYCLLPVSFEGYLTMEKEPVLDPENWNLRFEAVSSQMQTIDRNPARLATLVWRLVEDHVIGFIDDIRVDLGVPRDELKDFLEIVLGGEKPQEILSVVDSLRPVLIHIEEKGLYLENHMDVPVQLFEDEQVPALLTEEDQKLLVASWEAWDSFMIHMITSLSAGNLSEQERAVLLDIILRFRHVFSEELELAEFSNDLVRKQFVEAWELLKPVFLNHLVEKDSDSLLGYMAFFSAGDTLSALDSLGPLLGLDISREGLLRLARLLQDGNDPYLEYNPGVLPDLRRILGIEDVEIEDVAPEDSTFFPGPSFFSRLKTVIPVSSYAWAENSGKNKLEEIKKWVFVRDEIGSFLDRTSDLVRTRAEQSLKQSGIPRNYHALFKNAALATAWQESCFRQFIIRDDKIVYIRSYNNTSVGIMQINERVWRGIYDQESLRWDIAYNAQTGCEILELYFTKYALPRINKEQGEDWDQETIAGMLYAMYNGGPRQLERYIERSSDGALYLSDRLFLEKWDWVNQGALGKASLCLIGS